MTSSHPAFLPTEFNLDKGMEKAWLRSFSLSCQRLLEKEYQMPRVMLSALFRLQRFIPSSSLNSEGLDYIYLLAEIVTAQAVLITHCAGTGKGMKCPLFSGLHPSHPWLLLPPASTPPPPAGLGAAALRFPFCRGLGGLQERLVLLLIYSWFFFSQWFAPLCIALLGGWKELHQLCLHF